MPGNPAKRGLEMPGEDYSDLDKRVREIEVDIARLQEWMRSVNEQIKTFVTKSEFGPVRLIAYGLATAVMGSVVTAVIAKVIVK
jgi:hypothetical protein